jgi:hypothetical protein
MNSVEILAQPQKIESQQTYEGFPTQPSGDLGSGASTVLRLILPRSEQGKQSWGALEWPGFAVTQQQSFLSKIRDELRRVIMNLLFRHIRKLLGKVVRYPLWRLAEP